MTKFKTKIVQRFMNGHEFYELLLPNGLCVASGSLSHCWDERERWEEVLKMDAPHRCRECKHWEFSTTLGSPDVPEWHCRHGFKPSADCQDEAEYNEKCQRDYYRRHPEELQLELKFEW